MTAQTYVRFTAPVTLRLSVPVSRQAKQMEPVERSFTSLALHVQIDAIQREIRAYLPPIPGGIRIYGSKDFAAACADTMEQHAERVMQLFGSNAALPLQALIDGIQLPEPPRRVPREIANWRAKAILSVMGKLADVDAIIAAMAEPQATVMRLAWHGNAALDRSSGTVLSLGAALGMSAEAIDEFFIAADAINL